MAGWGTSKLALAGDEVGVKLREQLGLCGMKVQRAHEAGSINADSCKGGSGSYSEGPNPKAGLPFFWSPSGECPTKAQVAPSETLRSLGSLKHRAAFTEASSKLKGFGPPPWSLPLKDPLVAPDAKAKGPCKLAG